MDRQPEEEIRWHPLASRDITACQQTTRPQDTPQGSHHAPPRAAVVVRSEGGGIPFFSQDPVAVCPKSSTTVLHSVCGFRRTSPLPVNHRRQTFRSSAGGPMADRMADWTPAVSESSNGQDTKVFSGLRFSSNRRVVNPPTSIQQTTVKRQALVTTVAPLSPGGFFFRRFIMFVWVGACSFWIS